MGECNVIKKLIALIFIIFLFIAFIKSGSYEMTNKLSGYLAQDNLENPEAITIDEIENEMSSSIWHQKELIDLNGSMAQKLNMQGFYGDMGMYVTDDKYIISVYKQTATDYEVDQIKSFNEFLDKNGIHLLYVNEPTKYIDDRMFETDFGVETYSNRNMDLFIKRIRDVGIDAVDLRENILDENINISDLFYRTDHHWTTRAGLWATQIIATGLNKYCGYDIDTTIYNHDNFEFIDWEKCWLGEQGKKVGAAYVGLDDYTEIKPRFETSYTFKLADDIYEGTFQDFIDEEVYNIENDVYENASWHYSYQQKNCVNNNVEYGKLLILGDSFESVTEPFISLGIHEVDSLVLRNYDESFDLRDYILENGYDTVIVCYAQFMLGAHDVPSSANYRMFSFE